ncbi:MAG: periplasmic heavy metal sensor [Flavobacterium sp.]|nr:periplasmic heavy metal sensor [Flavobacterium sp.]
MEKIKLLTFTVIALLLLNLSTLGFLIFSGNDNGPHDRPRRPEPKDIIIKKLHFDKQQQADYQKLIRWHRSNITALDDSIMLSRNALYRQLSATTTNKKTIDSLTEQISIYQHEVETTHFRHFTDIKKLCRPEQQADFDALTLELSSLFSAHKPRP